MQKEIRTEMMTVGPELAKEFLEKNENNRNISQREVNKLVTEIKRGEYKFCPDPICFDEDGNLMNGQHRLTAIVRADMPVMCVVMFNVPRDAVLDRGRQRTAGEEAYMRGKIPAILSKSAPEAVARQYLLMNTNFSGTVPDSVLTECLAEDGDLILEAIRISGLGKASGPCRKAAVRAAIFHARKNGISEKTLEDFCRVANTGFMEDRSQSAAIVLRTYIQEHPSSGGVAMKNLYLQTSAAIEDFRKGVARRRPYNVNRQIASQRPSL